MHKIAGIVLGMLLSTVLGLGAPIEFSAEVVQWDASGGLPTTLSLRISGEYQVDVTVTNFTEIKNEQGFPVAADAFGVGDQVQIQATLTTDGWVALEIQLQDEGSEFELRGPVEALQGSTLLVNGFSIQITDATRILDSFGAPLSLNDLQTLVDDAGNPVSVKVEALVAGNEILAQSVKVLSRLVAISLQGIVVNFDGQTLSIDFGGTVNLPVQVEPTTDVRGTITPGALVEVKGYINADLSVTALKIRVRKLFELVPDELALAYGEEKEVLVVLEQALDFDLVLDLSSADPAVAAVLSPDTGSVTVPAGQSSATFVVKAGSGDGQTGISVAQAGATEAGQTLPVTVGNPDEKTAEETENEQPKELELQWTPAVVHAAPSGSVELRLMLVHGPSPEPLEATLELTEWAGGAGEPVFPSAVQIPAGATEVLVTIQFPGSEGEGAIRATLPDSAGSASATLEIELVANVPQPEPEPELQLEIEWAPEELKLQSGASAEVVLRLSEAAPQALLVALSTHGGQSGAAELSATTVHFDTGQIETTLTVTAADRSGKVKFRAQLPPEVGGENADLNVEIEKSSSSGGTGNGTPAPEPGDGD